MPSGVEPQTGSQGNLDCEWYNGCGIQATGSYDSYGPSFNSNGGGYYAMERTASFIKVWFFPRGSAPGGVNDGNNDIDPGNWVSPCLYTWRIEC